MEKKGNIILTRNRQDFLINKAAIQLLRHFTCWNQVVCVKTHLPDFMRVSLKIYLNDNMVYQSKTKVGHTLLQCHPPADFDMYMPKAI